MSRPSSSWLPKQFKFWPDAQDIGPGLSIQEMYEAGYAGAFKDPEAKDKLKRNIEFCGESFVGDIVVHKHGLADVGKGQLIVPYLYAEKLFSGSMPGPAQERGDCVAHSTKNACLITCCTDIISGQPDEISGVVEGPPEVPTVGIQNGVFSTEAIYWYRGYNGDGWSCEDAADVATSKAALWVRKDYPELNLDLSEYSGSLSGKYGRTTPPSEFTKEGQKHLIRSVTEVGSFEQLRDFLANGHGISTCGGEGYTSSRDENGVSRKSGSWSHAMAVIGADDRDMIKDKYGEPLVLVLNSWGVWNTGGRRILGTQIDIPEGSFWVKWSQFKYRSILAFAGAAGWAAKTLPPLNLVLG